MEPNNTQKNGGRGLLSQPRKAVSGMVYSGAIVFMLVVSLLFSVILSAIVSVSGVPLEELKLRGWYKYLSYLLYQFAYIAVILIFAFVYKEKPRAFGYRMPRPQYFAVAVLLAFGLLFSLNWANGLFVRLLEKIGYTMPGASLPSLAGGGLFGVLFVVAVLPALLEETIFRGIMLDGVKDIGTVAACLLGGLLFSVFHQSPAQTIYQFICGAVFTLVAVRADSVIPSMLMHFLNNAVIILDERFGFLSGMGGGTYIALVAVSGAVLAGTLFWLIFFDKKTNRKREGEIAPFMLAALPGLILCCVMWIFSLITGIAG